MEWGLLGVERVDAALLGDDEYTAGGRARWLLTRRFLQESQALCTRLRLRKNSLFAAKVIMVDMAVAGPAGHEAQRLWVLALSVGLYRIGTCGCRDAPHLRRAGSRRRSESAMRCATGRNVAERPSCGLAV